MTEHAHTHVYETMDLDMRPQDPHLDGTGLTFETLEHGGDYPDTMPQAIRLHDAKGRACTYLPVRVNGKVVRSISFGSRKATDLEVGRPLPPPDRYLPGQIVRPFLRRLFRRQRSA